MRCTWEQIDGESDMAQGQGLLPIKSVGYSSLFIYDSTCEWDHRLIQFAQDMLTRKESKIHPRYQQRRNNDSTLEWKPSSTRIPSKDYNDQASTKQGNKEMDVDGQRNYLPGVMGTLSSLLSSFLLGPPIFSGGVP